jgi:hypothetical protein
LRIRVNIEVNERSSGWIHLRTGKHCPEIPAIQLSDSPENRIIGDNWAIREQKAGEIVLELSQRACNFDLGLP